MTLLIAGIGLTGMFLSADTMITYPIRYGKGVSSSAHLDRFPGKLKIFLVNSDLCFGFSGSYDYAFEALRECNEHKVSEVDCLIRCLKRWHMKSIGREIDDTNFIVLDKIHRRIVLIQNKEIEQCSLGYLWTGSTSAYEALQGDMKKFDDIVTGGSIDGVGGIPFSITETEIGLRYKIVCTGGPLEPVTPKGDARKAWRHRTLTEGSFAYAHFTPQIIPAPVAAVFYYEAGFGYIYNHIADDSPIRLEAVTMQDFADKAANLTGIYWKSLTNNLDQTSDGSTRIFGELIYGIPE